MATNTAPETLPDTDIEREPGEVNEMGLTPQEQAEFDAMKNATPLPEGDEPPDVPDDEPAEGEPAEPAEGEQPLAAEAPAAPSDKTPEQQALDATGLDKKPAPKTVAYGKYMRELNKANAAAAETQKALQTERERNIRLAERVDMINQALQQAPAPAPAAQPQPEAPANPFEEANIDPNVDYAGAVDQVNRRNVFLYERQTSTEQEFTETREDQKLRDTFTRDATNYTRQDANFPAAYQFLKDSRLAEICISKFDIDPTEPDARLTAAQLNEVVDIFNREEKWVVGEAVKANKSPSVAIMKLARSRGFRPQAPAPAPKVPAVPPPRAPQVPALRAPAPAAAPTAAEQVRALAAAAEAGKSLSDGGGAPPEGLTAKMLADMSEEEFAELIDTLPESQINAIMGRVPL